MAMQYLKVYYDFNEGTATLSDAERGRLIVALVEYARSGEIIELSGAERHLFPLFKAQIDRDGDRYDEISEKRSQSGKKGGRPPKAKKANAFSEKQMKANESKKSQDKEKDKEEDKDKEKENIKEKAEAFSLSDFSPLMQSSISRWLTYKKERREEYKPMGLSALIGRIKNELKAHSEAEVSALIELSMSSGWKGIIWDRLPAASERRASFDIDELDELVRQF